MLMLIQFRFHPEKAVEAAALLLKLHKKPIKYLGLLKMLYIADRIAFEQMEQPITGDRYFSMNYGPVLSGVYDLIKGNSVDNALPLWSKFISHRYDNQVYLLEDPGDENLCEEEEEILEEVYKNFGDLDPFIVAQWTHAFPEWKNPNGSAIPILIEDILKNLGKSEAEISAIQQEAIRESYLDEVLDGSH